jgi:hypothetical protein
VIGNAVKVMRILTGVQEEAFGAEDGKDKAAQSLGQRGGYARAKALSAKKRRKSPRRPQPLGGSGVTTAASTVSAFGGSGVAV